MAVEPGQPAKASAACGSQESGTPVIMPHNVLSENELSILHPKLEAPDEVLSSDAVDDLQDSVYQHGLKIARDI